MNLTLENNFFNGNSAQKKGQAVFNYGYYDSVDSNCYNGVKKRAPSPWCGRMSMVTATRENSIKVPSTVNPQLANDPVLPLLRVSAQQTRLRKERTPNVQCSTIYNNQDMDQKIFY